MELKEIFRKKQPGFPQHKCNKGTRMHPHVVMYVFKHKGNIFSVSSELVKFLSKDYFVFLYCVCNRLVCTKIARAAWRTAVP
jgi:hypothetical protein